MIVKVCWVVIWSQHILERVTSLGKCLPYANLYSQSLLIVPCCWLYQMQADHTALSSFSPCFCFALFFLVAIGRTLHAMIILTVIQALGFALSVLGLYFSVNGKSHIFLKLNLNFSWTEILIFLFFILNSVFLKMHWAYNKAQWALQSFHELYHILFRYFHVDFMPHLPPLSSTRPHICSNGWTTV